jgi:ArsR family transcriptional regulator
MLVATDRHLVQEHRPEEYAQAAAIFKALAHPFRIRLVCILLQGPCTQTTISRRMGCPQSSVAQHLAVLRRQGLVRGVRKGAEVYLEVADPRVVDLLGVVCRDTSTLVDNAWNVGDS